jgi:hypothetical protein
LAAALVEKLTARVIAKNATWRFKDFAIKGFINIANSCSNKD